MKISLIVLPVLLNLVLVKLQAQKGMDISVSIESDYSINFWEDIEDYVRKNKSNNFGHYIGFGLQKNKFGIVARYGIQRQHYADISPDDPSRPPWRIIERNHLSKMNYYDIGLSYSLFRNENYSITTGVQLNFSTFTQTTIDWLSGDGRTNTGDLKVDNLDTRIGIRNYFEGTRDINRFTLFTQIGQQSILKGLNPEPLPPLTVLDKNTKSSLFFGLGIKYKIARKQNE